MGRIILFAFMLFAGSVLAQDLVLLTGGTSGVYYPLGDAIKRLVEREIPAAKVTVVSTQASVENLNLLQQGRGSFTLAQGFVELHGGSIRLDSAIGKGSTFSFTLPVHAESQATLHP